MTVAPRTTPTPPPSDQDPDQRRPDLHLVRTPPVPPEEDTEITGPIPVLGEDGKPIAPQAPLDVRLLQILGAFLKTRPRFSERPASFAESWEYSTTGDWTTSEKSLRRVLHGLCTVLAYAATYPLEWLLKAREKPVGFLVALALVIVIVNLIAG